MSEINDNTSVETQDLDLNALLNPGSASVMLPSGDQPVKNNIFSRKATEDISFLDKDPKKDPIEKEVTPIVGDITEPEVETKEPLSDDDFNKMINDDEEIKKATGTGRPKLDKEGLVELTNKLIEKQLIVPFEGDKPIDKYTLQDFEDLFEANAEERERKIRESVPGEFFQSLPDELQSVAEYVANGGKDLKGYFRTLAAVEEVRSLDTTVEADQKQIVRSYLQATNFGDAEEIEEEINQWNDRNELEAKANKFKPKLDALSERQIQYLNQQQENMRQQQAQQAQVYMDNIYKTLEPGELNGLKLDKKIQNTLFSGLVQPNYKSVNGSQTNLLGHLLEKYQFIEPNHGLIAEALWLLADPESYKSKVREVEKKAVVAETVRKLKGEESKKIASYNDDDERGTPEQNKQKTIPRPSPGFFKR